MISALTGSVGCRGKASCCSKSLEAFSGVLGNASRPWKKRERLIMAWSVFFVINKQLEKSAINVKEVLRRLYSYALHPSSFKRLGSALGFNHIYTVLRSVVSLSSFAVDEDIRSDVHFWNLIKFSTFLKSASIYYATCSSCMMLSSLFYRHFCSPLFDV